MSKRIVVFESIWQGKFCWGSKGDGRESVWLGEEWEEDSYRQRSVFMRVLRQKVFGYLDFKRKLGSLEVRE